MEKQTVTETPVFPYYLDEEMVMSFLATIDDGLSIVRTVSQTLEDSESGRLEGEVKTSVGWFPFNLGARAGSGVDTGRVSGEHWEAERQYPLISLFNLLRQRLFELDIAKAIDEAAADSIEIGDIVEFSGSLQRNPIIELGDIWSAYKKMKPAFGLEHSTGNIEKNQGRRRSSQGKSPAIPPEERAVEMILDVGVEGTKNSGLMDVRVPTGHDTYKDAVLTLRMDRNPAQAIAFSQGSKCKVIGKVTGITPVGEEIPLFRRSGLEVFPINTLEEIFGTLNNVEGVEINLDAVSVKGPAIQILPLAVFV
ncbi:MAG: hypothetical protein WBA63_07775 [Thermomicrobiales bacterium]